LNAWTAVLKQRSQVGEHGEPFTGDIIYSNSNVPNGVANCILSVTSAYTALPASSKPDYEAIGGPNSNNWLNGAFGACGISLNLGWFGY
jgi:hypothetical protein